MAVSVLERYGRPVMPCTEKRARLLLERGRARVHHVLPFVIRLVERNANSCEFQPLRLKLDPGSKVTGIARVREFNGGIAVLNLFDLIHRGRQISEALPARRNMRRARRGRNTHYRAPRFLNRRKPKGWLAPSLQHRVDTTMAWVNRICRWAPVTALSTELVRFDMQAVENPKISGVEYQQGTLAGYEVREYLLEKWGRKGMYCDKENVPLQMEHITPRASGDTNRISNLGTACQPCNHKKAALDIRVFLKKDPTRLARILAQAKRPLRDTAAVNATRWALFNSLKATDLTVEASLGGRAKYNRCRLDVPKTHALDAACVGAVESVTSWCRPTLAIKATGRGSYQRTRLDKYGFPRGYLMREKSVKGFQTGDMVRATVTAGKKFGTYAGRVAVRASGNFYIQLSKEVVQGISHHYCTMLQRADGYGYSFNIDSNISAGVGHASHAALSLPGMNAGVSRAKS
ncbi:HNH endonuclease [Noviherbaspirillum sp. L7-7A]|uniref:RNA-guided endonuclease IscB n=1 Tax=Noviherbaspirillum sp. L7-7A TaxID=2850560 RepID=UPI001C2C5660|nr:RNA-guided endonuclease IscB [Noviherbaspirillum sp. L7-7A]MBV0882213.1 HNH endonuclease [Noviherbaspirillum sp. L7-7A]